MLDADTAETKEEPREKDMESGDRFHKEPGCWELDWIKSPKKGFKTGIQCGQGTGNGRARRLGLQ